MLRTARALACVVVVALVGLSGCGRESPPASSPAAGDGGHDATISSPAFPAAVEAANGTVRVPERPERIVSLSPTATETLFAIGAGDRVVAVDDQSDFPPQAPRTALSGYQPNLEAIIGYRPDLVVVSDDSPTDVSRGLERAGVPVLAGPSARDLDEAYEQILALGTVTGEREAAAELVTQMRSRIEELVASVPAGPRLRVFHELGPDLYTASSDTFIGRIYTLVGLENVADEAAKQSGNPYPQLSSEYLLAADPDLVVLADGDCCQVTPELASRRPGWQQLTAVRNGAVVAVTEDIASRWGPRVPEFVEAIVEAIESIGAGHEAAGVQGGRRTP